MLQVFLIGSVLASVCQGFGLLYGNNLERRSTYPSETGLPTEIDM